MSIQRINNGKGHWYKLDGEKADGVTTLIGGGVPKPALVGWAARKVAEYVADNLDAVYGMRAMGREAIVAALKGKPYTDRNAAAVRGTHVHKHAERLILGEPVDVPEQLVGYVESCARFLDDYHVEPVLTEAVVANYEHRYCGTLDVVADMKGGRAIIDYKTSASGIYGETALQLAAYSRATSYLDSDKREHSFTSALYHVFEFERAYGVQLTPDSYEVHPLDFSDETFELFLHAAAIARTNMRALVGDPLIHQETT